MTLEVGAKALAGVQPSMAQVSVLQQRYRSLLGCGRKVHGAHLRHLENQQEIGSRSRRHLVQAEWFVSLIASPALMGRLTSSLIAKRRLFAVGLHK